MSQLELQKEEKIVRVKCDTEQSSTKGEAIVYFVFQK